MIQSFQAEQHNRLKVVAAMNAKYKCGMTNKNIGLSDLENKEGRNE